MKQIILKTSKYVTQDKKIPTMKAVLISDGTISASADDFILRDLSPDAKYYDLTGKTLIPAFIDCYGDFLKRAREMDSDINTGISKLCEEYVKRGITTAVQKNASVEDVNVLKNAGISGALTIDIAVYLSEADYSMLPEQMPMDNVYENHVRLAGASIYVDAMTPVASLTAMLVKHIEKKQQVALTADTKEAIALCMSAYRQALCEVNGTKTDEDGNEKPKIYEDLRPLICGCRDLSNDQLTELQSLGFVPCFAHDLLFAAENDYAYPLRDVVRRGMAFAVTHDEAAYVSPIDSLHLSINRASDEGYKGENQTINSDQALMAQTLYCAYAIFEDLKKGSLTMTKNADLVVLDRDPLETSDSDIKNLKICLVIKNGEIIYSEN